MLNITAVVTHESMSAQFLLTAIHNSIKCLLLFMAHIILVMIVRFKSPENISDFDLLPFVFHSVTRLFHQKDS